MSGLLRDETNLSQKNRRVKLDTSGFPLDIEVLVITQSTHCFYWQIVSLPLDTSPVCERHNLSWLKHLNCLLLCNDHQWFCVMHGAGTLHALPARSCGWIWIVLWNEAAHERRCERTLWVLMAVPKWVWMRECVNPPSLCCSTDSQQITVRIFPHIASLN